MRNSIAITVLLLAVATALSIDFGVGPTTRAWSLLMRMRADTYTRPGPRATDADLRSRPRAPLGAISNALKNTVSIGSAVPIMVGKRPTPTKSNFNPMRQRWEDELRNLAAVGI